MGALARKAPNRARDVRLGREPRHHLLDPGLSLAAGGLEDVAVILRGEEGREELDRREVHGPLGEQLEDEREPAGRPGHFHAVVGLPLGKAESVSTIDVERRVTLAQVYLARVELREVGDDLGGHVTFAGDKGLDAANELGIGQASERSEEVVLHTLL